MDLDELRAFLAVADSGSLAAGARDSGMSRATLRRRVDALEARFGVPLLRREGVGAVLTPHGERLAAHGRGLVAEAAAVHHAVLHTPDRMEGLVTLHAPLADPAFVSALLTLGIRARHPDVRFAVRRVPDPVAALADDGDMAVHWGRTVPDGPWIARRMATVQLRLVTTHAYATTIGVPETVDALCDHPLLVTELPGSASDALPLLHGGVTPVAPALRSPDREVVWSAMRQGGGIAFAPLAPRLPDAIPDADDLVRVLPETVGIDLPVWAVAPRALSDRPATLAVVEDSIRLALQLGLVDAAARG